MSSQGQPSPRHRAIKAALSILLLGPPIGSILLFFSMAVFSLVTDGAELSDLLQVPLSIAWAVMTAPIAYLIGGPFALIAAVLTGVWVGRGNGVGYGTAVGLAIGSCLIALAGNHVLATIGVMEGGLVLENFIVVAPVAIGAALVLRWLTRLIGWV